MSRVTRGASNLGKIARDYGMLVKTLQALIDAYPDLREEVDKHTFNVVNKGQKTLPPNTVDKIYTALGAP